MTPLEQLYRDLNQPNWFWPSVLGALFLIFALAENAIEVLS